MTEYFQVWDFELEAIAQRWADQCQSGHDTNRMILDETYVGQNVAWSWSSGPKSVLDSILDATQSWYDEVHDPGYWSKPDSPFVSAGGAGHYTQVVWADTEYLGCGMVYKGDEGEGYEVTTVCNYAVGGNFAEKIMYRVGEACSECPSGYSCDEGLCSRQ